MARYALIRDADRVVVNVIEADGSFKPPPDFSLVADSAGQAAPGDTWDGSAFAPRPTPTPTNRDLVAARAVAALSVNDAFLALAAPSNVQTVAQVQALTRECSALIRLLLGQLDATSGT